MCNRTRNRFLTIILILLLLAVQVSNASAQVSTASVGIFYIGPEDTIAQAINLANPYIVRVDQPELAQVIVINNASISEESLRFYGEQVRNSRIGLVIFCGDMFPESLNDLSAVLGVSAFGWVVTHSPSEVAVADETDTLPESVTWSSAPEIRARTVISNPNILLPLITTETGQPIIQRIRGREPAQTLIVGSWFDDLSNDSWRQWPYYHYLIYRLITDAAGRSRSLSYADFPLSPVPHRIERWGIAGAGVGIIVCTAVAFYIARRLRFMRTGEWQYREVKPNEIPADLSGWNRVGFHRPLAGLLVLLPLNILLYVLLVRYRLYTLPDVIVSDPNVFSSWQLVEKLGELLWLLLDAGTGIAAVRYFAALRVRYPQRAFHYFQYYVWWQLFMGAVQLGIVALLTAVIIPGTRFAHLTYFILVQSIIRFPGFLAMFTLLFRAMQRLDYEQYLSFFLTYGSVAFQIIAYLAYTLWGVEIPVTGAESLHIAGLGLGLYAAEWLIFIVGLFLYYQQGYKVQALFIPFTGNQVSRQLFGFGLRAVPGALAIPLGIVIQISVLDRVLPESTPIWQNWIAALQIASIFDLILRQLYRNMIPALTEALTLNYKSLLRYYMTAGVRYGMWFSVFILAVFAALGQHISEFILTGTQEKVAEVLFLLLSVATFRWAVWQADALFIASERPGLSSALIILEQVLSIGGGLLLAPQWGILGFLSAYAIAFLCRALLSWIFMQRAFTRVHIYIWQTLVSPSISGILIYYLLYAILNQIPATWHIGFIIMSPLVGLWIYAFLTAVFGGWDNAGLQELERALRLSGIGKPFAWVFWQCIRLGAYISPLHGRFPVVIANIADEQAKAITYTRSIS
jgi:O-antigen/teichoic acid export membrane protein